jgi:hypothetical protein
MPAAAAERTGIDAACDDRAGAMDRTITLPGGAAGPRCLMSPRAHGLEFHARMSSRGATGRLRMWQQERTIRSDNGYFHSRLP